MYEWPPLPILDRDEAAQALADALQESWNDLEDERLKVLASRTMGRKRLVNAWIREFQAAIETFGAEIPYHLERFITLHLMPQYLDGVRQGGGQPVWTTFHSQAFVGLATDTYGDFLRRSEEAQKTSRQFAERIRKVAARELPKLAAGGRTAEQAGRRFADQLIAEYDINHVFYRDGTRVPVDVYTRMAARTKSTIVRNAGTINESVANGVKFVEVFDGTSCGWTRHGDSDRANGSIRHVEEAAQYPLAHPNCQRTFGPRPDITTKAQAKTASPSTTAEQRADQADIDWTPQRQAMRDRARQQQRGRREQQRAARREQLRSGTPS